MRRLCLKSWDDGACLSCEQEEAYATLLRQCGYRKEITECKRIHSELITHGYDRHTYLGNLVVQMYGQCGCVEEARNAFARLPQKNVFSWNIMVSVYFQNGDLCQGSSMFEKIPEKNVVSWRTIVIAYAQDGCLLQARRLFDKMPETTLMTFTAMVAAYGQAGQLVDARNMFHEMPMRDVVAWNAMIAGDAQNGNLNYAKILFEKMPLRSVVSWNSMIAAYSQNGHFLEAKCAFDTMPQQNAVSWNSMVGAYGQDGNLEKARGLFDRMPQKDSASWNNLFGVYVQNGQLQEAKRLYDEMPHKSVVERTAMFQAYAQFGNIEDAKSIFDSIPRKDVVSWTAMFQAYALSGNINEARNVFDQMPLKNLVAWNSMIGKYAQDGEAEEAFFMFQSMDMEGFQPDRATFLSLLDVRSNISVANAKQIHTSIRETGFSRDAKVASALISMYGKCGTLADVRQVSEGLEEWDLVTWDVLVAAYARTGHIDEADTLFQVMVVEGVQPDDIYFISILTACSHAGLVDVGRRYFVSMREDFGINPTSEHYSCVVDLLGRAGWLKDAEELVALMPFEPKAMSWSSLLGATITHGNTVHGSHIGELVITKEIAESGPYVLLRNIHASAASTNIYKD